MQKKIIKVDNKVIIMLEDGCCQEKENMSESEYIQLIQAESDEELAAILCPNIYEVMEKRKTILSLLDRVENSSILTIKRDSVYWEDVSPFSLPVELVEAIITAEEDNNELKLETYKNFWTLMSLNPDEECRKNLFWFLNKNGLQLSKYGFFVAYRNVDTTNIPDVYTDHHSRTFKIEIGKTVTLDRNECDCDSKVECSRGLHLASKHWLNMNYYGTVGLVCLCNPADVVAVPYNSNYGKLRTCAYLPIDKIIYKDNHPIPYPAEDGFECKYVTQVIYEGLMGTSEDSSYKIEIPEVPGLNKESIADKLFNIAKESIINKTL